jgi:hypothetical protein
MHENFANCEIGSETGTDLDDRLMRLSQYNTIGCGKICSHGERHSGVGGSGLKACLNNDVIFIKGCYNKQ